MQVYVYKTLFKKNTVRPPFHFFKNKYSVLKVAFKLLSRLTNTKGRRHGATIDNIISAFYIETIIEFS